MEVCAERRRQVTVNHPHQKHRRFDSYRLHQIWLDRIKVITSDCLSDYRGSIPRRVAKQHRVGFLGDP
jgi:hypothetical protein